MKPALLIVDDEKYTHELFGNGITQIVMTVLRTELLD